MITVQILYISKVVFENKILIFTNKAKGYKIIYNLFNLKKTENN